MRTEAEMRKWVGLVALLVAEAMNLLDATIVQVAAPVIHGELGGATSDIQWFGAAYTLPFAALLITGGRLGDLAGRRRVFRIGVTGFVLASIGCALATQSGVLIGARAIQGATAAAIIPQTIGLIRSAFSGPDLPKALGSIGPVMGLAGISGPVLGGVITEVTSWRVVFLVNVPLGLAVLGLARLVPESRSPLRRGLDLPGTGLLIAGSALLVFPILQSQHWFLAPIGLAVLAACVLQQRATGARLLELSLFARPGFGAALVTSTLFFAVLSGLTLVVVLHQQLTLQHGVLRASLALLPWSAASGVSSWCAGQWLVQRVDSRLMYAGLGVLLIGLGAAHWWLIPALGVAGAGVGLFTTAFFTEALSRVEPHETGSAAGLLNAVQQFGGTLGVAGLGSVFLSHPTTLHPALLIATAAVLGTLGSAHLMRSPRSRRRVHAAPGPAATGR
ncbi:MFS transporter [Kribbella sandramycini]|uniref:MFS transporter n=2 Tax=Kribbella sandramycini TaxID=60450 RepID=A0A7Y4P2J3_9ACTN|nr:MFS transporter [Kribbella sandramycini]